MPPCPRSLSPLLVSNPLHFLCQRATALTEWEMIFVQRRL